MLKLLISCVGLALTAGTVIAADMGSAIPTPPAKKTGCDCKDCQCGAGCNCPFYCDGGCKCQLTTSKLTGTNGKTLTMVKSFVNLPEGYRWESTAEGHGVRDSFGNWYLPPSPEYTTRLNNGYCYVPTPEFNNWPRGYWVSPCVKDADCRVVECRVPATGQHGLPTSPTASQEVTVIGNSYHPNYYTSGYQRVCQPQVIYTTPNGTTCVNGKCYRTK